MNSLKYHPFLIKPNIDELSEIFDADIKTEVDVEKYAGKLREMGARNVLVSMGGEGAVLLTDRDEVYKKKCPEGVVKNSVGAGDSMVAGFIAGFLRTGDFEEALKLGIAAGSATAFSDDLADRDTIMKLYGV